MYKFYSNARPRTLNFEHQASTMTLAAIQVHVTSDLACPWCYVGKKRLDKACAAFPSASFTVTWYVQCKIDQVVAALVAKISHLPAEYTGIPTSSTPKPASTVSNTLHTTSGDGVVMVGRTACEKQGGQMGPSLPIGNGVSNGVVVFWGVVVAWVCSTITLIVLLGCFVLHLCIMHCSVCVPCIAAHIVY